MWEYDKMWVIPPIGDRPVNWEPEKEPTMTLHECCEAMRANRISMDEPTLSAALEAGRLPFGMSINVSGGNKRMTLISRYKFYIWMEDFIGGAATRV